MAQDWHPADVKAALAKKGLTLSAVALAAGFSVDAGSKALGAQRPWPGMKRLIAKAIGLPPQQIWPSLFDEQGNTRQTNRPGRKRSTGPAANPVRSSAAA